MADLTPQNALKQYRLHSTPAQNEQARIIRKMRPKDALELLAYMAMHNVSSIQYVHGLVDPGAADTQDMPESPVRN